MSEASGQRIGLFGGTFNPIHFGHLLLAEHLCEAQLFDKLYFIPARIHPLKDNSDIIDPGHRLEMLKLATAGNQHFAISDIELTRDGASYTIDTVKTFRARYPKSSAELFFLIGSDNVSELERWRAPLQLMQTCQLLVIGRPGSENTLSESQYQHHLQFIDTPLIEISSTEIRQRFNQGRSIRYMLPVAVEEYIQAHKLYQ